MISACIQQLTTTSLSSSAGTRHWSCTSCSTGGRSTAKSLSLERELAEPFDSAYRRLVTDARMRLADRPEPPSGAH